MTNKLLEILEEFDNFPICFNYGERAVLRKFLSEKLVEYARSIIPTPEEVTKEFFIGNKTLTQVYIDRINQDIQSLND